VLRRVAAGAADSQPYSDRVHVGELEGFYSPYAIRPEAPTMFGPEHLVP
jgi:hypothetical protein